MSIFRVHGKTLFFRVAALVFWAGLILWLTLTSSPPVLSGFLSWDKLQHAGAYLLLTLLSGGVFTLFTKTARSGWILAAITACAYGTLMEVAQGLLTSVRHPDGGDILANASGALAALVAVRLMGRGSGKRGSKP